MAMQPKGQEKVFDQNQTRAPPRQIKAVQDLDLMALDIDGDEVDVPRPGFGKDFVQGPDLNLDSVMRLYFSNVKSWIEGRMTAGQIERHERAGISAGGARGGDDFCGALPPEIVGEFRLGLDKDARPTLLFKIVGLRALLRPKCADVNEITLLDLTQKGPLQLRLNFLRKYRAHGSLD